MTKKALLVLTLGVVLSFVFVSSAFAAATSTYATWTTAAPNLGAQDTPHASYQTGTVKCAVCHAVHKAPSAGGAEVLLRSSVANGCNYCHIENNLGLDQIYNGDAGNYTSSETSGTNHQGVGGTPGSRCVDCHATHGAGIDEDSSVIKYILRTNAGGAGGGAQALATANYGALNTKQEQITIFCTECHPYFQNAYNGTITTVNGQHAGSPQFGVYQSHVMTATHADYTNASTAVGVLAGNVPVAWAESQNCRSCHDAGTVDAWNVGGATVVRNSYPHYTPDYTRFMTAAAFEGDAPTGASYTPDGTTDSHQQDGVCLKCHKDSAVIGVGETF